MNALAPQVINPDPSSVSWPPLLPWEIALRQHSVQDICASYGLSLADWDKLRRDPLFVEDLKKAIEALKQDGMSFKVKAKLQAEMLLGKTWEMIHASYVEVPAQVKSDLIKATFRIAGYDEGKTGKGLDGAVVQQTIIKIDMS